MTGDVAAVDDDLVGVPARVAARLAGVTERRLRSWEAVNLVSPDVRRELSPRNVVRLYGFPQLVELLVVRELEERHSLHIRHIKRVVEAVRSAEFPRPLRQLRWAISGDEVFVQYPDGTWVGDRKPAQTVMREVLNLEQIRAEVRRRLGRTRPQEARGRIERRRGVQGSKPVFEGTRTPVAAVHAYLRRGASEDDILAAFPHLTRADIRAARELLDVA